MAQHVEVTLVDDIDGSVAVETVSFGLDGRQFDIDLSADHAAQLRNVLAEFVAAARRGDGRSRRRASAPSRPGIDRDRTTAVREWAKASGHMVSDRGRIAKSVLDAYENRDAAAPGVTGEKKAKKSSRKG